jgi:hypothetical protein
MLPVGAKKPASVGVHMLSLGRSVALLYVPSLHGSGAAAASRQYEPASHGLHAVAFSASLKRPAAQSLQLDWPGWSVYVPGLHGEGVVEPVAQLEPRGQSAH